MGAGAMGVDGTVYRKRDALARAALADLGERGRVPMGERVVPRGGTRVRTLARVAQSVWYAPCEHGAHYETVYIVDESGIPRARRTRVDVEYHYAPSWARMPADSHIAQETHARRSTGRTSQALRHMPRDPDTGRFVRGAIAGPARVGVLALRFAGYRVERAEHRVGSFTVRTSNARAETMRPLARRSFAATLTMAGAGL